MTEQEVHSSVQMNFNNHVNHYTIKSLNAGFWKTVHESWCSYMSKSMKNAYDLSNHTNVLSAKISMQMQTTSKINYFHGRFSVLSSSRTPFKLKLFNRSHRYHSGKTNSTSKFND